MADMAFNTIAEIQRLRDAGFEQAQAEAITLSIHAGVTGGVATKADLELVRSEINSVRSDLDLLRTEVGTELKWIKLIGGAIFAVVIFPWLAEVIVAAMPG